MYKVLKVLSDLFKVLKDNKIMFNNKLYILPKQLIILLTFIKKLDNKYLTKNMFLEKNNNISNINNLIILTHSIINTINIMYNLPNIIKNNNKITLIKIIIINLLILEQNMLEPLNSKMNNNIVQQLIKPHQNNLSNPIILLAANINCSNNIKYSLLINKKDKNIILHPINLLLMLMK